MNNRTLIKGICTLFSASVFVLCIKNNIFASDSLVPPAVAIDNVVNDTELDDEVIFSKPNEQEVLTAEQNALILQQQVEKGNQLEQVLDEDKEGVVVDNSRHYPKWQGKRKRPVKDYEYYIKVNKKTCTVTVYIIEDNGKLTPYKAMVCSVGRNGHDTPEGTGYKTSDYYDWRLMVDNTYGRYAVRFNGSIMFHSVPYYFSKKDSLEWQDYNKLGKPASLGCIRLAVADAKWIFDNCKRGTKVDVYSGPASTDPLGTPEPIKLDTNSEHRDWDPTDLTLENPWLVPVE